MRAVRSSLETDYDFITDVFKFLKPTKFNGYIGDGCWKQNELVITIRCW